MARVDIRHLQKDAGALIGRARAGETIEVTEHSRPVARMVGIRAGSVLDQIIAEGRAPGSSGDLLELKPLPPPTRRPLSKVLAEMRSAERGDRLHGYLSGRSVPIAPTGPHRMAWILTPPIAFQLRSVV
jgi:prevent-host-death family protein